MIVRLINSNLIWTKRGMRRVGDRVVSFPPITQEEEGTSTFHPQILMPIRHAHM